jgi:hypothetical protein
MSGEQFSNTHRSPSAVTASEHWLRAAASPFHARSQLAQRQFHCGKPPPAADPRTTACTPYRRAQAYELISRPTATIRRDGLRHVFRVFIPTSIESLQDVKVIIWAKIFKSKWWFNAAAEATTCR